MSSRISVPCGFHGKIRLPLGGLLRTQCHCALVATTPRELEWVRGWRCCCIHERSDIRDTDDDGLAFADGVIYYSQDQCLSASLQRLGKGTTWNSSTPKRRQPPNVIVEDAGLEESEALVTAGFSLRAHNKYGIMQPSGGDIITFRFTSITLILRNLKMRVLMRIIEEHLKSWPIL